MSIGDGRERGRIGHDQKRGGTVGERKKIAFQITNLTRVVLVWLSSART